MSLGQKEVSLKKKYFGKYIGEVPSYTYKIDIGSGIVQISSSSIYVFIDKDVIVLEVGNNKLTGSYDVLFKARAYYLLEAKMEGQIATERIMVYKRGKHLSREGMFPQPFSDLIKSK